jgi:hypothetical protein
MIDIQYVWDLIRLLGSMTTALFFAGVHSHVSVTVCQ